MPLLYGEGVRAFRRLQEEIMKVSDDDSLFAWKNYDYDWDDTRGMLAASPWDFRDGTNIVQSKNGAYSPYSMTNQGLQIKLPLLPIDPKRDLIGIDSTNTFKTILKCTFRNKEPIRWIVIYLRMIREGYYERIFPHWLDDTGSFPNETELTSLLIPQVDASTTRSGPRMQDIEVLVEILPTMSGFTANGHSLMKGYSYPLYNNYRNVHSSYEVTCFEQQEKRFGVAIGLDNGIPWLDFTNVIDEKQSFYDSYREGGPRACVRERHLDRLSERIPGEDWWVTVSVRKTGHGQEDSRFRVIIDIQRVPIRAKGWYIPSGLFVSDTFDGDFPGNLNHHNVHPDFKKDSCDWFAVFNPRVKRVLDVGLVYTLPHKSLVHCVQFSYNGKYLATGSDVARVYDMKTGTEICTFIDIYTSDIYSICLSPDSKFLATGGNDGKVQLWDINAKCVYKVFDDHQNAVRSLCFSPDARLIISGSRDGTVWIWEIADGTSRVIHIHGYMISVAISPDGRFIAAGSSSGIIQIWDLGTTELQAVLQEREACIAFTPDGKGLVSGSTDKTLKYWDVSGLAPTSGVKKKLSEDLIGSGQSSWHTMTFAGHKDSVNSVAISYDGRWVISGSKNGRVLFWDLGNGTAQFILKARLGLFHHKPDFRFPLFSSLVSLDMNPVCSLFATNSEGNGIVRVWRYDDIKNNR